MGKSRGKLGRRLSILNRQMFEVFLPVELVNLPHIQAVHMREVPQTSEDSIFARRAD